MGKIKLIDYNKNREDIATKDLAMAKSSTHYDDDDDDGFPNDDYEDCI